jgi:predicted GIY-YIG superfamily endonuclease
MHYVYLLETVGHPRHFYVGSTSDLRGRIKAHNAGQSLHTAKLRPWKLRWYCAFESLPQAEEFERYLKSASGRAFSRRHL